MKCIKYIESVPCIMGNATGRVSIAEKVVLKGDSHDVFDGFCLHEVRQELFNRNIITNDNTKWFDDDGEFYVL